MKYLNFSLLLLSSLALSGVVAKAIPMVDLGTASSFTILAGSKITDAGGVSTTTGDVGLSPASGFFIGLTAAQAGGTIYATDAAGPLGSANNPALLTTAKNDLTAAYIDAAGRSATTTYSPIFDLAGLTLSSGVYNDPSSFGLTGTLTLDAGGDPNAVWIFQTGSTLTTASSSKVVFKDGVGSSCNVFWQIGSSATIGTYSDFVGNIMADQSIALDAYATLDGSALARIGAVTLDHNTISMSDCGVPSTVPDNASTLLLLGSGLVVLLLFKGRFFSAALLLGSGRAIC
jgi:hypothetical protein